MRLVIRLQSAPPPPPVKRYVGWRVLHKVEGGWQNTPLNMPEVLPPIDAVSVTMTDAIQTMSWELMSRINPTISKKQWTAVHAHDRAFTNGTGFNDPDDPRRNIVTGDDLSAPLPRYDKCQRTCGGNFLRGEVRGDRLVCVPGVHGIDSRLPMPSVDEIVNRHWLLYAVTVYGSFELLGHFPQGNGGAVAIPFIMDREISFPLYCFERWEADVLPNPLTVYRV